MKRIFLFCIASLFCLSCEHNPPTPLPGIILSTDSIEISAEGGKKEVSTTLGYQCNVKSSVSWVKPSVSTLAAGESKLYITVNANTSAMAREATVTIYNKDYNLSESIYVYQSGADAFIKVEPEKISLSSSANVCEISVNANVDYTISSDSDWCSVPKTGSEGKRDITVEVSKNESGKVRTAIITFSNSDKDITREVTVVQESVEPLLEVDTELLTFSSEGGEQTFTYTSNVECVASENAKWFSIKTSGSTVTVVVEPFDEVASTRSAYITIAGSNANVSHKVKVEQSGLSANLAILYTTSDDAPVKLYTEAGFGANIVSNTYNGKGVILFDAPVTQIPNSAFKESKIKSVTIPESVEKLGSHPFIFCRSLTYFSGKFASEDGRCLIEDGVLKAVSATISGEYTLPSSVTKLGKFCFTNQSYAVTLVIPNSVTEIDEYGIMTSSNNISGFKGKFATASGMELVYENALYAVALYKLTSYEVPEGITVIKTNLFQNSKIEVFTLPSTLEEIGVNAFNSCTKMTTIYCKAVEPPVYGSNAITSDVKSLESIYVPAESVEAYKSAKGWKDWADYIKPCNF